MELKREVAKKAAYSRTDKGIPEKKIDDWEEKELEKNKIVFFFGFFFGYFWLVIRIKIREFKAA